MTDCDAEPPKKLMTSEPYGCRNAPAQPPHQSAPSLSHLTLSIHTPCSAALCLHTPRRTTWGPVTHSAQHPVTNTLLAPPYRCGSCSSWEPSSPGTGSRLPPTETSPHWMSAPWSASTSCPPHCDRWQRPSQQELGSREPPDAMTDQSTAPDPVVSITAASTARDTVTQFNSKTIEQLPARTSRRTPHIHPTCTPRTPHAHTPCCSPCRTAAWRAPCPRLTSSSCPAG